MIIRKFWRRIEGLEDRENISFGRIIEGLEEKYKV